jgi:hypothetical protein
MTMRRNASGTVVAAALATIALTACGAAPVAAFSYGPMSTAAHNMAPWRVAVPLARFALIPFRAPAPSPEHVRLERDHGWTQVGFDVRDSGIGVYLDVQGRMQFDRAEIVFTDGELERIELHGASRGRGLYQLAEFGVEREVLCVRLLARAATPLAHVEVKLGR